MWSCWNHVRSKFSYNCNYCQKYLISVYFHTLKFKLLSMKNGQLNHNLKHLPKYSIFLDCVCVCVCVCMCARARVRARF